MKKFINQWYYSCFYYISEYQRTEEGLKEVANLFRAPEISDDFIKSTIY